MTKGKFKEFVIEVREIAKTLKLTTHAIIGIVSAAREYIYFILKLIIISCLNILR